MTLRVLAGGRKSWGLRESKTWPVLASMRTKDLAVYLEASSSPAATGAAANHKPTTNANHTMANLLLCLMKPLALPY